MSIEMNPPHMPGYQYETQEPSEGFDKKVYKIVDGDKEYAAKFYLDYGYDKRSIEQRAIDELAAYRAFRSSSIGIYIPEPHDFLRTPDGNIQGIAIEWRNGIPLSQALLDDFLTPEEMDKLQINFTKLLREGLIPNRDMYTEGNIMIDRTATNGNRIWIAECELLISAELQANYMHHLRPEMMYLRKHYTK